MGFFSFLQIIKFLLYFLTTSPFVIVVLLNSISLLFASIIHLNYVFMVLQSFTSCQQELGKRNCLWDCTIFVTISGLIFVLVRKLTRPFYIKLQINSKKSKQKIKSIQHSDRQKSILINLLQRYNDGLFLSLL